ncbi:MAG: endonuclease III [Acidimicrobiales bacterium]
MASARLARTPRRPGTRAAKRALAATVIERLSVEYPGTAKELCALGHDSPFQLLAATILSAQCTDERVNMVTPELFACYPTPEALGEAAPQDVERIIMSTGFFRAKTRNLIAMASALVDRFGGQVPSAMEDLVTLPGVGRKTANVVRSVAFDLPGLPVDTHVGRLVRRLGLSDATDPVKVEFELDEVVGADARGAFSLRLILHGRAVCKARTPMCEECVLVDVCASALVPVVPAARNPATGRGKEPKVAPLKGT